MRTPQLSRLLALALGFLIVALVTGRVEALMLAAPAAGALVWRLPRRAGTATTTLRLSTSRCVEGEDVTVDVELLVTGSVDEVALAFPSLKIVMTHVGDPWIPIVTALLVKHPNVSLMTSGWSPKRVPAEIWHVQEKRNPEKVMWASDYPVLTVERTVEEGLEVPLSEGPRQAYLGGNALRVFGAPPA